MDEISITVMIADRSYKLTISRSEEETLRAAAKAIDEQIKKYASYFEYKDKQDLLAMVALQFSTTAIDLETQKKFSDSGLLSKLEEIDEILTDV
ncbi:MAG: cell division protein ZapA [Lentimicrobiaceae bacterium]|nr:cell division protein ZapA [Lentimicrobiaceae bacterium]MCB9023546.1 cell division protein ZapA [Lentimicrobiaceae bacterium]MCO5266002.1 cell division protein ZapA [Lentimicrobium sp.]HPG33668.1 cell division protein ZapA [Lentimicrobium sp.]